MTGHSEAAVPSGPIVQSIDIGFWVLRLATLLLAAIWLAGNIHPVPPGMQSLVLRFGRVARVQQAGLVVALPRPIETVVLLPSGERQMEQKITASTARQPGVADAITSASDIPADAGVYMTGDGGVVLLDATLTWRISDAAAYYVMQAHVAPALRRLFMQASVVIAARHDLDDFLAARPERARDPATQTARNAIRGEFVAQINASLRTLEQSGEGLGVEAMRADISATLPPGARSAFDAVLEASQHAEQELAAARTDAATRKLTAYRERDRILSGAHAAATERVEAARTATASITALEAGMNQAGRPAILDQLYRDRIAAVLQQAGGLSAVDPKSVSHLILSGAQK
jgi:regulator of protease activity HflC (stomatin/prohibitin superfamily)